MSEWDDYWSQGHTRIGEYFLNSSRKKAIGLLKDSSRLNILDVGCGKGDGMNALIKAGHNVLGIDSSMTAIRTCQSAGLNVIKADATDMPFGNNTFDAIYSEGLLEHFEDFKPIVKEMARISSKYILLIQPNHFSMFHRFQNIYYAIKGKSSHVKELTYKIEDFDSSLRFEGFRRTALADSLLHAFLVLLYDKEKKP